MVKKHSRRHATFKVSQYLLAIIIGLLTMLWASQKVNAQLKNNLITKKDFIADRSSLKWWLAAAYPIEPYFYIPQTFPWVQYSQKENRWWRTITKDDFRCKGKGENPPIILGQADSKIVLFDCWGCNHGLPWIFDKEYIYPSLLDILNRIQEELQTAICITSAHRCLSHHRYITMNEGSSTDRHLMGTAVDFYIQEESCDKTKIINAITKIIKERAAKGLEESWQLKSQSENVWLSKEIELKWWAKDENRSLDNAHAFDFWQITLKYDQQNSKEIRFDPNIVNSLPLE
jgi:hypothetical protein